MRSERPKNFQISQDNISQIVIHNQIGMSKYIYCPFTNLTISYLISNEKLFCYSIILFFKLKMV